MKHKRLLVTLCVAVAVSTTVTSASFVSAQDFNRPIFVTQSRSYTAQSDGNDTSENQFPKITRPAKPDFNFQENLTDEQKAELEAKKAEMESQISEMKAKVQALVEKWNALTDAQKEEVYALKDLEFDAQIETIDKYVALGLVAEQDVAEVKTKLTDMKTVIRENGNLPGIICGPCIDGANMMFGGRGGRMGLKFGASLDTESSEDAPKLSIPAPGLQKSFEPGAEIASKPAVPGRQAHIRQGKIDLSDIPDLTDEQKAALEDKFAQIELDMADMEAKRAEMETEMAERKAQAQAIADKWDSMTDDQKEAVYVLKDKELDAQISIIDKYLELGLISDADAADSKTNINNMKAAMRENGCLPGIGFMIGGPGKVFNGGAGRHNFKYGDQQSSETIRVRGEAAIPLANETII